jgi:1,2-diacylglycerol 3-alpha-glucosyltransferase
VVPTGIDLSKFEPSRYSRDKVEELKLSYGIQPEDKVMLYIGRVSQEKNIGEIVEAMPGYMPDRKNVKFLIIGSGPALSGLEQRVEQLGLSKQFIFAGAKPWDQIGLYYQLGDVFVSASKSETQGLTYIEAMASGLPVVARDDKCLEDILEQGKNGYPFTDVEGLYYGLDQVLFTDQTTNFRENAIEMVSKYSMQEFAYHVEEVYQLVMSRDRVFIKHPEYDVKKI